MHSLVKTIKHNWKTLSLRKWAKELDIPYITLYTRYKKGYSTEKLLSTTNFPKWRPSKSSKINI